MKRCRRHQSKWCVHFYDPAECGICAQSRLRSGDVVMWHGHRWGVVAKTDPEDEARSFDWWIEDEWVHQRASIDEVVEVDFEDAAVPDDVVARAAMYRLVT